MGKQRPSVGLLLSLLMKAELFRAADYLAQEVLKSRSNGLLKNSEYFC